MQNEHAPHFILHMHKIILMGGDIIMVLSN